MEIPDIFFGSAREVHSKMKRKMKVVKNDFRWDGFSESGKIETNDFVTKPDAFRVLFELEKGTQKENHFRMYAPFYTFDFSWGTTRIEQEYNLLFDVLIESSWGLLVLLSPIHSIPTVEKDERRTLKFFERLIQDWETIVKNPELFAVGPHNKSKGKYFWDFAHSQLLNAMVGAGFPISELGKQRIEDISPGITKDWIQDYILK